MRTHSSNKYAADLPYPELTGIKPNLKYAMMLQDNYAGRASELTAITQYCYQHFHCGDVNQGLAEDLMGIAKVEMRHLELLGEAIKKLGGTSAFYGSFSNQEGFWNGNYVNYDTKVKSILETNIKAERNAIETYTKHAERIGDPKVQELLRRIIRDEEVHAGIFSGYLDKP